MATPVVSILSSLPGSGNSRIAKLSEDFKDRADSLSKEAGDKFHSRAELDGAGLGRVYDNLQRNLVHVEGYEAATKIARDKLMVQKDLLQRIRDIMVEFNPQASERKDSPALGDPEERSNAALKKLTAVLNTKVNGEYVFGGKHSKQSPLAVDLTKKSNIISGIATTNYTNVAYSSSEVSISVHHTVEVTHIHAADKGIASYIAVINDYKRTGKGDRQTQKFWDEAEQNFGRLQLKVSTELDKLEPAEKYNSAMRADASRQVTELFSENIVTAAAAAKASFQSLLANFQMTKMKNDIFDRLMSS